MTREKAADVEGRNGCGAQHAAHHRADDAHRGHVGAGEEEAGNGGAGPQPAVGEAARGGLEPVDGAARRAHEVFGGERGGELHEVHQRPQLRQARQELLQQRLREGALEGLVVVAAATPAQRLPLGEVLVGDEGDDLPGVTGA